MKQGLDIYTEASSRRNAVEVLLEHIPTQHDWHHPYKHLLSEHEKDVKVFTKITDAISELHDKIREDMVTRSSLMHRGYPKVTQVLVDNHILWCNHMDGLTRVQEEVLRATNWLHILYEEYEQLNTAYSEFFGM